MSACNASFKSARSPILESIKKVRVESLEPDKCEQIVQIGLFFDGTRNNRVADRRTYSDSNIARLHDAYPAPALDTYRVYVPGVGTPFREIGEHGASTGGAAFGIGCEARVIFGLLKVLQAIHQAAHRGACFFNDRQIELLCSRGRLLWPIDREEIGSSRGLLGHSDDTGARRRRYLRDCANRIQDRLGARSKPVIKQCLVDVFGFSRGAAEARVFCNWLDECLVNGTLAGVPVTLRFLGIFDTVAASGLSGHDNWASAEALRVPQAVVNCVHLVAMHEVRRNFPLDEISTSLEQSRSRIEIAYPGSHSDIGGGYEPGELGVAAGSDKQTMDKHKLSQICLNHMYDYAVAGGVPLVSRDSRPGGGALRFPISTELATAYANFIDELGPEPRKLFEWMSPYLAWRWQIQADYKNSYQYKNASKQDRDLLLRANRTLRDDAHLLTTRGDLAVARTHKKSVLEDGVHPLEKRNGQQAMELAKFDDEAVIVLAEAMKQRVSPAMAQFFDLYVHDSLAGFGTSLEGTGYWRYRKSFRGTTMPRFASEDSSEAAMSIG